MKSGQPSPADGICVVCGKDTAGGRGFLTLHVDGRLSALCCPMCQKVYQDNPALHAQRLKNRETPRDVDRGSGSPNPA